MTDKVIVTLSNGTEIELGSHAADRFFLAIILKDDYYVESGMSREELQGVVKMAQQLLDSTGENNA